MDELLRIRTQLKNGGHRLKAVSAVIPPSTARKLLYSKSANPKLGTLLKLENAGMIETDFPLDIQAYRDMLSGQNVAQVAERSGLSSRALFYIIAGEMFDDLPLKTAVAIYTAVNCVSS